MNECESSKQSTLSDVPAFLPKARKKLWPILLGAQPSPADQQVYQQQVMSNAYPQCRDFTQIEKDVNRSLWHFVGDVHRPKKRRQLLRLLNYALHTTGCNYYQGLHDIAGVLLLVCGEQTAAGMTVHLLRNHLKHYVTDSLSGVLHTLALVLPIVAQQDPPLARHIQEGSLDGRCHFALAWVLTWFAHQIDSNLRQLLPIFDLFLASDSFMPVYFTAAVLLHRRLAILDCPPDFATLHTLLTHFPHTLPVSDLRTHALALFDKCPPIQACRLAKVPLLGPLPVAPFHFHLHTLRPLRDCRVSFYLVSMLFSTLLALALATGRLH
eukprot:NODE_3049_length_1040_cov_21.813801_g2907_i0.p1 GENE.NODE_3049_length_1040_cov_21.813801_g2907_i0~~NODE_3049_length_1040_cov_21.813801_g2907_i0.p1  ORF type:complete len:343 (+),score=96.57 NODE_3049_length_1040_cov_21.813801_g2907_i0:58-1029(+)